MIGGQQLALSLANNAAFNVQQRLLGSLNVKDNLLSLVKTGGLAGFRPNYQITVPSKTLNKVLDTGARILGFTLPKSLLSDSGSIFQSESGGDIDNVTRTNNMILNTGSGQVISLLKNATANLNRTSTSGATHLLGPHLEVVIRHHTLITMVRLRLTATTSMLTQKTVF
jgi:hypothetical protein